MSTETVFYAFNKRNSWEALGWLSDVTVPWGCILRAAPGPGLRQARPDAHFKEDLLPSCRMRSAGRPQGADRWRLPLLQSSSSRSHPSWGKPQQGTEWGWNMKALPFLASVLLSVLLSSTVPELPTQVARAPLGLRCDLTVLSAQSYFLSFSFTAIAEFSLQRAQHTGRSPVSFPSGPGEG